MSDYITSIQQHSLEIIYLIQDVEQINSVSLSNYKARSTALPTTIIAGLLDQVCILLQLFHPTGYLEGVYFDQN